MRCAVWCFLLTVVQVGSAGVVRAESCEDALYAADAGQAETAVNLERFQRLFAHALESGYFSGEALARFHQALQSSRVVNPMDEVGSRTDIAKLAFYRAFEALVVQQSIDAAQLLSWVEARLQIQLVQEEARRETSVATQTFFRKMGFAQISAGTFWMPDVSTPGLKTIKKDFGIQTTQVTQWQWSFVAAHDRRLRERFDRRSSAPQILSDDVEFRINPSHFNEGADALQIEIEGHRAWMQADHPVEQISFEDATVFVSILNEWSAADDPRLYKVVEDHLRGAHYDLPSLEQWKFVYTDRGEAQGHYPWVDGLKTIEEHIWIHSNSGNQTHAVGLLQPLVVQGQAIYDMMGNVTEWTNSLINVMGYGTFLHAHAGASFFNFETETYSDSRRITTGPTTRGLNEGLRLVRTRPEPPRTGSIIRWFRKFWEKVKR